MEEAGALPSGAEAEPQEATVKTEQSSSVTKRRLLPRRRSTRMASLQFQRKMRLRENVWKSRTGNGSSRSPIKRTLLNRTSARKRSLLHLDSADESAPEAFELPIAAEVEEVVEPKLGADGRLFFSIKFFNKEETELVPRDVAYAKYPREMIEFYERILEFSVRPSHS